MMYDYAVVPNYEKVRNMKIYKRESNSVNVLVWNDSGVDWMVQDSKRVTGYPIKSFTMKEAIKLHCEIFGDRT